MAGRQTSEDNLHSSLMIEKGERGIFYPHYLFTLAD